MMINSINDNSLEATKHRSKTLIEKVKAAANELTEQEKLICADNLSSAHLVKSNVLSKECLKLKLLLDEIDSFLKTLEKLSFEPESIENYLWICDTAISWEHQLSDLLNISRTVPLADPSIYLLPPLDPVVALSEKELQNRVRKLAKVVSFYRKKKGEPAGNEDELKKIDLHRAEVFLANDILDGTIDFSRRISWRSFKRLESIWMAEIRELLGYLDWEASGAMLFDPNTQGHYINAWEDLRNRIISSDIKATSGEFGEVKRYLEYNYLAYTNNKYQFDPSKDMSKIILNTKSLKIRTEAIKWDSDREWDNDKNWLDAEHYVKQYYENIIPAVMEESQEHVNAVIRAFDFSMKGPYRIINSFEMAIVIYYFSNKALSNVEFPDLS